MRPGATIGIVGGGQLGRMLAATAHQHGYRVAVLTGGAGDTPAGTVAEIEIAGGFTDDAALARFLTEADVVTWEFENVDVNLAEVAAARGIPVRPSGAIVAVAQDREREKSALADAGVAVVPWEPARTLDELRSAVERLSPPVIAKAARFGYDGKGQVRVDAADAVDAAWRALGGERLVVEKVVPFERELSVIVARSVDGSVVDHGVMENVHVDQILDTTVVPAGVGTDLTERCRAIAHRIAEAWDLVGVLCVELFATGAEVVANEVAPRPHNSGHCTIEAAASSQFEQQLRAICGIALGDGSCRPAAMAQLLGDLWCGGEPDWAVALADPAVHLHLYGKTEARPGRKMGHMTCVDDDPGEALRRVTAVRDALTTS